MLNAARSYANPVEASLRRPIIPLTPVIKHSRYEKITLSNDHNVGTAARPIIEKRREEVFFCSVEDVEYIIDTYLEFDDSCSINRLNLNTVPKVFNKFRQCLGGTVRDQWDIARDHQPMTQAGWDNALDNFVGHYVAPNAIATQKIYLDNVKKPQWMKVQELYDRLNRINRYMMLFPGAGHVLPLSENDLKFKFYMMLPSSWQLRFTANSVKVLTDVTLSFEDLKNFMKAQETADPTQGNTFRPRGYNQRTTYHVDTRTPQVSASAHDANADCPYHMHLARKHKWRDCFGNPSNPRFRPSTRLQLPSSPSRRDDRRRDERPRYDDRRGSDRDRRRDGDRGRDRNRDDRRGRDRNRDDRGRRRDDNRRGNDRGGRRQDHHYNDDDRSSTNSRSRSPSPTTEDRYYRNNDRASRSSRSRSSSASRSPSPEARRSDSPPPRQDDGHHFDFLNF